MLYWRLQVQTRQNFSYTVQVTPSYLVRTCEQEWDQTIFEKSDWSQTLNQTRSMYDVNTDKKNLKKHNFDICEHKYNHPGDMSISQWHLKFWNVSCYIAVRGCGLQYKNRELSTDVRSTLQIS